jgi:hypothetical protein
METIEEQRQRIVLALLAPGHRPRWSQAEALSDR